MSKISVIIPLYNQKEFVGRAIESALGQSYRDREVVVVDDGSTDNPATVLASYGSEIALIRQKNRGLAGARNRGLKHARGDYIQFLDADDLLHMDKIRLQLEFMAERSAHISYCEIVQLHHDTKKTELKYVGELSDPFPSLYNEWFTYPFPIHSLLFRKEVFDQYGAFPEDLRASEDRFFLSHLALRGEKFHYFPFIGGYRRRHDKNMTKDRPEIYKNMIRYYRKINTDPLAYLYMKKHFPYSGRDMMRGNLTFMFLKDVAEGLSFLDLVKIRRLLKENRISFFSKPIPSLRKLLKGVLLLLRSIYLRFTRKTFVHHETT